tara:strand:+ start:44183 stop:44854 length:672 start_codon:yes stop_codon:yes gene_type:complete
MVRNFSAQADTHRSQLESEYPWVWLYELQTTDDPPQRYRLTNFTKTINHGMSNAGVPLSYSPAPIIHSSIEEGADGSLPTMTFTVGHAGPIVANTVDAANGFVDQPMRVKLVSLLDLDNPEPAMEQGGEVVSMSITSSGLAFKISAFNLYQLQFPPFIHSRRRCRWIYGSSECGMNIKAAGVAYSTCSKTLTDCELRGDDEVLRSLPRRHPARFGASPGIPRN